jgi:uncharacterized protein YkwD
MPTTHRFLIVIMLCLFGFELLTPPTVNAASLNPSILLSLINLTRTNQGIPPLHPDPSLDQAATSKAQALIDQNQFTHNVNQQPPWVYFDQVGYRYALAGENLAQGFSSETAIIDAWLNSPTHAANLLSPDFIHSGIGIATDTNTNSIVVHLLASPLPIESINYSPEVYRQTTLLTRSTNYLLPLLSVLATFFIGLVILRHRRPKRITSPNKAWWKS